MTKANDLASLLDANGDVVSSALDNVPASDLVNDTTPQLGGNLDLFGNNITGNGRIDITSSTSPQLKLSYSADTWLKLSQSGGATMLESKSGAGDGEIYLMGGQSGKSRMIVRTDGDVEFFNTDGVTKKMEWNATSNTLDVTGSVTADGLSVDGDASLQTSDGAILNLKSTDNTLLADDVVGSITFETADSSSAGVAAKIEALGENPSGGVGLNFYSGFGGSPVKRMTLDRNGSVGIGTGSPQGIVHIDQGASDDAHLILETHSAGDSKMVFSQGQTAGNWAVGYDDGGGVTENSLSFAYKSDGYPSLSGQNKMLLTPAGNLGIGCSPAKTLEVAASGGSPGIRIRRTDITNSDVDLLTGGGSTGKDFMVRVNQSERMRIDESGRVTMPNQPAFAAVLTTSSTATSGAVIPVNSAPVNIGNHYNTSTYTFTAPVSGRYFLSYFIRYNGYQASIYLHPRLYINGGAIDYTHSIVSIGTSTGAAYTSLTWSGVVQLAANDAITLHDASQGGVTLGTYQGNQTGFTGHLIG